MDKPAISTVDEPTAARMAELFASLVEKHTLTINHAIQYLPGQGLRLVEPKTKKSKRTIKLPDFVYQALCEHFARSETHEGLMFTTANGTPFSPRNFVRDFKAPDRSGGAAGDSLPRPAPLLYFLADCHGRAALGGAVHCRSQHGAVDAGCLYPFLHRSAG